MSFYSSVKRKFQILGLVLISTFCIFFLGCKSHKKLVKIDAEFSKYIEAFSSGTISKKSAIRIQLAVDANISHPVNDTINKDLFSFSPSVKGKAYWIDARTIEFKPEQNLSPDQLYEVSFNLDAVLQVPQKFKEFKFNIQTYKPSFEVEEYGLKSVDKNTMQLSGQILTADIEESATIEKLLSASINGKDIKISWQHNESQKKHGFVITDIQRSDYTSKLLLQWDGKPLNVDVKDKKELEIPILGEFKVLDVRAKWDDGQYTLVQFSDPIAIGQSLVGLITVSNQTSVSYTISGSEIKVYSSEKLEGNFTVYINNGIENIDGKKLPQAFTANISFNSSLPTVTIQGKGVLLPNNGGKILLPFDAINLKAVDVSIVKIYENNIAQFLQDNNLDGGNSGYGNGLRTVARPLVEATLKLDEDRNLNLHKKNRFVLDLDKYIKTEPGAIYRVYIAFRPEYSLYPCSPSDKPSDDEEARRNYYGDEDAAVDDYEDFWRRYQDNSPFGYNWGQQSNPCSVGYYTSDKFASRNILSTNIGLTAKKGAGNTLFIAVNNLLTTEPMSGVDLQVLDYQHQIVAKGSSNSDGIANLLFSHKPYLLIAKKGSERSYLKLDDGSSLMQSKFDIGGAEIKNGIKMYVFGERGVWRPGDTLFLSCIVEDKENKLPKGHPLELNLTSPTGQLYKREVHQNAEDGFNVFKIPTSADVPTGNWSCKVKIGATIFEKPIKIETIIPNKLKINLDFGGLKALGKNTANSNVNGTLSAKWLFGAVAQSLKARVDAQLYKQKTKFDKYDGYDFDNPTSSFATQSKIIYDGTLSKEGTATINPHFEGGKQAPGMLLANLVVKVFEPGGNFSIDNISLPFHPYSSYAGIHVPEGKDWGYVQSGQNQSFNIVNLNTEGQLVPNNQVDVELYKIQWRWWWDNSDNGLSNFTQDNYNKLISKQTLSTNNGKIVFNTSFKKEDWGRYLILVKDTRSGHTTGKVFFVDNDEWRSRGNNDNATSATMLSFTADKSKYNVGDMVNLTIPSGEGGKALISIETGSKVLKTFWVATSKGQTKYSFKAEKEMSPNVYVNISLLQPHAQTLNDLPIRMYGVVPILVDDKNTILKPVIQMASIIKSEQKTAITVSESEGKKMSYIIAIVDDGLLDLTHFKTPDPHNVFYAKEALGVKSWDVYDFVIGAWGGSLERILTIGGDAEAAGNNIRKANRFKPVVCYMGPFKSNGGSNTHYFTLPAYMGSVRAMVIAANDGAYGKADKEVTVKKPLMVLATLPRVLSPTETLRIPVTVFATDNNIRKVNLSMESNQFIEGGGSNAVTFTKTGEQTVYFDAKVKTNTGIGKVKVTAISGEEKAVYETEIDIRNPNPVVTQVTEATLTAGQSFSNIVSMMGDSKSSKATLEVSSVPAINLQKRLSYLIEYPYGCIEQTTSAVFPQLFLSDLMELTDARKSEIDKNIRAAIVKMQTFQQPDGGFSYWPGTDTSNEWGSNYAGHFLIEASKRGYQVPQNMLSQWRNYEWTKAYNWNVTAPSYYGGDLIQAYRLYLLALSKNGDIGTMNRLKEYKFLTPEAKWRLAAAYFIQGQQDVALQLISGLPTSFPVRTVPGKTFGSELRDESMVLESLTVMGRTANAAQLVRSVAARLSQEDWYSTQTTAYALLSIAKYSGSTKTYDKKISLSGTMNGKAFNTSSNSTISQTSIDWQNGKGNLTITNKGSNTLYVRVINEGRPVGVSPIQVKNNPSILNVSVSYMNTSGQGIDITKLKQGTDFIAKVVVKNPGLRGNYTQMALKQIFPSGWEILNTRFLNSEGQFKSSESSYMDIRDDRVYHYFDIKQGETLTYYVQLNAAYTGKYFWPGIYCEAMYNNTISGGVSGKWVEVSY